MTTRETTKATEKALPPALEALAARIDAKALVDAQDIYERIANSLQALMERTGATPEVLAEVIGMLGGGIAGKEQSKVLVDFAREKIILKHLSELKRKRR